MPAAIAITIAGDTLSKIWPMITRSATRWQSDDWQRQMADSITSLDELLAALELERSSLPPFLEHCRQFPLRVPRGFVARMEKGNPDDPLLRQILPLQSEQRIEPGFTADPVGDLNASVGPGLLQKYHGRALLVATGACAIHCRYCFRRNFPYQSHALHHSERARALQQIAADRTVSEVILSGGDPLTLADEALGTMLQQLEAIPHVQRLRIHSRLPVVIPERLHEALLQRLAASPLQVVLVIHVNHGNELSAMLNRRLVTAAELGLTLLNQSVLLRGVNDNCDILARLSEQLFRARVLPYYLHHLDRARGTAHFEVPQRQAMNLYRDLLARLPGYLVPRLVREEAGMPFKTPTPLTGD